MGEQQNIDLSPSQLSEVKALLNQYLPNTQVWAYGSRVHWSARPNSDLDMVAFANPEQQAQVSLLREAFEESNLPFSVDLFVWDNVPEPFRKNIQAKYVVVQGDTIIENEIVENEWPLRTLGDLVELKRGYDLPKKLREKGLTPIISSSGISDYHSQPKIKAPGVITGRYGTIGEVFYSDVDFWPLNTTLYVRDFKGNDPKFIYYFLKTIPYQHYNDKAAVPGINRNHLHMAEVSVPTDIKEQKYIAHILSTLDDKIQLNRQTNQTLEQMAQALFKSWFVDFDPVIDNALAAGNPIPPELAEKAQRRMEYRAQQQTLQTPAQAEANTTAQINTETHSAALPKEIRELFPSEFEFTEELGWVPKGWMKTKIGDIAKVIKGKSYKSSELEESETALVTLKSFTRGGGYRLDGLKAYTGKFKPEQEVFAGDLIIAYTDVTQAADVIGKPAMVIEDPRYGSLVVSLDVAVVRPERDELKYFLYGLAQTKKFQAHTHSHSTGTTVLHLGKAAVPDYLFAKPSDYILKSYIDFVKPCYESINRNIQNNRDLEILRDTLLPKLISGELRLPEAEQPLKEFT